MIAPAIEGSWAIARCDAGRSPDDAAWRAVDGPMTAAASLRSRGEWSLDGASGAPALDFDAHDWWWRVRFRTNAVSPHAVLGLDGIATVCAGWLNDQPLFDQRSMFVPLRIPCAQQLREGTNELKLHCRALAPLLAQRRGRPRWRVPMLAHQQWRWFRTTLLGRTPGWSPPAAPVGPWRPVWLAQDGAPPEVFLDATLAPDGRTGVVRVRVEGSRWSRATLVLERAGRMHSTSLRASGAGGFEGEMQLPDVDVWWPHTHGEPALYAARIEAETADGPLKSFDLDPAGFRAFELDTTAGRFALRVNGERIFCRGACWMPLDPVSLQASAAQNDAAIAQACAAGMNMLRVPGTTVYESSAFHRACDRHGVLVWQEFMFASCDYPEDDAAFDADVRAEVDAALRHVRSHASTAILCGNSEVSQQAAMWGAPRQAWEPPLFHELLPAWCRDLAPGIPYWPSSAHGGDFPHQADRGTTSYYGVGAYRRPLDDARASELSFATECLAFANIPSRAALARLPGGLGTRAHHPAWKQRSPRDLGAGWDFDDVRDHYVQQMFGIDPAALRQHDHERYLALGRQATAEAMAAAFAQWRRAGSACGGALVLQLRDLWAGAGWGLADEQGAPKACWHALARLLQPVAAWICDDGLNGLRCHVANDTAQERAGVLEIAAWRGSARAAHAKREVRLAPRAVQVLGIASMFDHMLDLGWAWRFGPAACDAVVATLRIDDAHGAVLSQAFHFPQGLALPVQDDLGLEAHTLPSADAGDDEALLALSTRSVAVGVHVDAPGWQPEDDHFHLAPGETRTLRLRRLGARAGAPVDGTVAALNARGDTPIRNFARRDVEANTRADAQGIAR